MNLRSKHTKALPFEPEKKLLKILPPKFLKF